MKRSIPCPIATSSTIWCQTLEDYDGFFQFLREDKHESHITHIDLVLGEDGS